MTHLILLVSDDGSTNRVFQLALLGTTPVCRLQLATGRAEIEASHTPSLILLDLSHEAGFDILRWLRTGQRYKKVPVFVLAPPSVDVDDAYALGANSCFPPGAGERWTRAGRARHRGLCQPDRGI